MKGMKKLLSILMVLTLVLSLGATAFAASVTVETDPGHEYKAYQIFSGTSQVDGDGGALGNLNWGDGIKVDDFINALGTAGYVTGLDEPFNTPEVAREVAKQLSEISDPDSLKEIARIAAKNVDGAGTVITNGSDLGYGYYVIVDTTNVAGKDEVQNEVVLQVSGDVNVQFKSDKPSSDKKVKDINDSQTGSETDWQDSADHDIGDTIHYRLHAKLPSDVTAYETYYLQFVDTLSKGLTYLNTVKITIAGETYDLSSFTVAGPSAASDPDYPNGTVVTWTCNDLIDLLVKAGKDPKDLNGADVYIEYEAKLNDKAVIGDQGNPNEMHIVFSNTPDGTGHGQNEDDKVTVFTLELIINKVDGEEEPLEGAGFTLYKKNASGEYKKYSNDKFSDEQMVKKVTGTDGKEHYQVDFQGLDDGDYKIVETTTPPGYNTAEDIEFTITAEHEVFSDNPQLNSASANGTNGTKLELEAVNGVFETTVKNEKGVELPETGGIGTTIFYIAGAVLVAGAVILLVTKKRVSGMEK